MTDLEFDILDELYFVETFENLHKKLNLDKTLLKDSLKELLNIGWIKCFSENREEIFTDLINFDEKKIFSSYLGNITGDNNTITESNIISDKLLEEELKAQYNARLLEKDKEIVFLRAMLEKTMDK